MLLGQYENKLDVKFRVGLPKKFKIELGDQLIITKGYENSLIIVSEENWKTLLEGTADKPLIEKAARETQRFLLGGATSLELDSKGRFIVPSYLRSFAKIQTDVVFLGLSRYIEMWDTKIWEAYREGLNDTIDSIAEKLLEPEIKEK